MKDITRVQLKETLWYLEKEFPNFLLHQRASHLVFNKILKISLIAVFHNNVEVCSLEKAIIITHDVRTIQFVQQYRFIDTLSPLFDWHIYSLNLFNHISILIFLSPDFEHGALRTLA